MIKLIQNETMKMLLKKKILLVFVILLIEIAAVNYGQYDAYNKTIQNYTKTNNKNYDWKPLVNGQIQDIKSKLSEKSLNEGDKRTLNIKLDQYEYYLNNDINPVYPSSAKFTADFMEEMAAAFLPLLVIIFAGDSVSQEFSSKTIKVLLTRAVPRHKILLSKFISLVIMSALIVLLSAFLSIIISFVTFKNTGFMEPAATGFRVFKGRIISSGVIEIHEWQYLILMCSLCFFVAVVISAISLMVSVFARSTAASIGIMMACLIGGGFFDYFINDWPLAKYFFPVNLNITQYLTGTFKPTDGMNLTFSIIVLSVWALSSLVISLFAFCKRDVLV